MATWKLPEPVAFVKVMPVDDTVPKAPAFVTAREPILRLPDPVAFVKVIPVLLTVEARKNPVPFVNESVVPVAFVNV